MFNSKNLIAIGATALLSIFITAVAMIIGMSSFYKDGRNNEHAMNGNTHFKHDSIRVIQAPSIMWNGMALTQEKFDSIFSASGKSNEISLGSVSADKMNVFYIGVDNPLSIVAAGVAPDDISPSITGGTMTISSKGRYIVRVSSGTEATVEVNQRSNGIAKKIGSYKFRVKRVPDPVAYVGSIKHDGQMTKAELNGQSGVFAKMENFDFDLHFNVVSFVMLMNVNGVYIEKKANGPAITPEMKTLLSAVKPGGIVVFDQITVQGPDGTIRKISPVIIKVK
jgi:gliding motility-associated protein GldM